MKQIKIRLIKIKYNGDSIGDDINIEIKTGNKNYQIRKRINNGTEVYINESIGELSIDSSSLVLPIKVKIIEDDLVFDDVGSSKEVEINLKKLPQQSSHEITVNESRGLNPGKKSANFVVTLEVSEVTDIYRYVPLTQDGWFRTRQDSTANEFSLPSFLMVRLDKENSGREYFTPQEGIFGGKQFWVTLNRDEGLASSNQSHQTHPLSLIYSISRKTLSLNSKSYKTTDFASEPWETGIYNIEIPDHPHGPGLSYPNSKYAKIWFKIGGTNERYIHIGQHSRGCITLTEIELWDDLCLQLLKARNGDGINIGTLKVIT